MGGDEVEADVYEPIGVRAQSRRFSVGGWSTARLVMRAKLGEQIINHRVDPCGRIERVAIARAVDDGELDRIAVVLDLMDRLGDLIRPTTERIASLLRELLALDELLLRHVWTQQGACEGALSKAALADEHHAEVDPGALPLSLELGGDVE